MGNYKHMNLDDRVEIQKGLKEGKSFAEIGAIIGRDGSTISKEIRSHLVVKETGTRSRPYNPCIHRKNCQHEGDICGEMCIQAYLWHRSKYCCVCEDCYKRCREFKEETCRLLMKPPYTCNGCKGVRSCTLKKKVYDAKEAQKEYEAVRSESRQGINLTAEELRRVDDIVAPLIRQGQSIHHICTNNAADIMLDERTIYNYVDAGLLSVGNIDLPRKVVYRKRKVKKPVRVDKQCHVDRTYEDFQKYKEENPDIAVVEMDSVESSRDSSKVLLTLHFCSCNLMLAFLRDANTARSVTDVFNCLQEKLGMNLFQKLFPVILTDRGSEFTDPSAIECDASTGELRTRVFYCDPRRSDQKGSIEVTHEFIRRVLPKGTSFEFLTQEKVDLMMDHINSYKRKKLNDQSPLQLFSFLYGADVLEKLNSHLIDPSEITLKPELLK